MSPGPQLASTSLSAGERRTLERFVTLLREHLGDDLSIWLYGSRARGERPHPESDVDILVATPSGGRDRDVVYELLFEAAELEGTNPFQFSAHVVDPDWVQRRREIRSFFMHEVDRDKVVLVGDP